MATIKMIQPWQRSRIFGLARELGLTTKSEDKSDNLHQLIDSRTGKASLTMLTFDEANGLLGELGHQQRFGNNPSGPKGKKRPEKPGGVSAKQQNMIWAMMYELRGYDLTPSTASLGDRLAGIIRKELQMDATAENPFAWLDNADGRHLIDKVLKHYVRTAKRKATARSDAV